MSKIFLILMLSFCCKITGFCQGEAQVENDLLIKFADNNGRQRIISSLSDLCYFLVLTKPGQLSQQSEYMKSITIN